MNAIALNARHIIGIIFTLILVVSVGIYSTKKVKNATDFSVGGRSVGATVVAGTILGTIIGGSSTIGAAQLAFEIGFSAWWYALASGIACFILGMFLARPLRQSELETVPQFLTKIYGSKIGPVASIFSSIGTFFSILAQILSATALLSAMFNLNPVIAATISVLIMIAFVVFGGVWGAGLVGITKLVLVYFSLVAAGTVAYLLFGGMSGLRQAFPAFPWFSLFGQGTAQGLADGFSVLVGVLSTQTYIQAIFSGKDVKASRNGALVSAVLMPPTGFAAILVGMYMRAHFPQIASAQALPLFVLHFLNPWLAGIILATLFIVSVSAGAGLVLGTSTMLTKDIYKTIIRPGASDRQVLNVQRLLIIFISALTVVFTLGNLRTVILQWNFLSMGLRGATICFPLLAGIFLKKYVSWQAGVLAAAGGPLASLVWKLLVPHGIDPLYIGLLVNLLLLTGVSTYMRQKTCKGRI